MTADQKIVSQIENVYRKIKYEETLKELAKIISDDEVVEQIIEGIYKDCKSFLVATDSRVVLIGVSSFLRILKVEDFPYSRISSVEYKTGLVFCDVKIIAAGNKAEISCPEKDIAARVAEYINQKLVGQGSYESSGNNNNLIAEIERLGKLKEQSLITEEEFIKIKESLLKSI